MDKRELAEFAVWLIKEWHNKVYHTPEWNDHKRAVDIVLQRVYRRAMGRAFPFNSLMERVEMTQDEVNRIIEQERNALK
jgi:hypothetical protein